MIELNIPGRGTIRLEQLVCDVNGTLALDGQLYDGLPRLLNNLQDRLNIHLLTADTHGKQAVIDQQLGLRAERIQAGQEGMQKADYVMRLDATQVVALLSTTVSQSLPFAPYARQSNGSQLLF